MFRTTTPERHKTDMDTTLVPAHVPAELVRDFDYVDLRHENDVYLHYKTLHDGPDIFYTPHYGGHWVVTRHEDMENILSNAKDFSNRHTTLPKQPVQILVSESDGPIHGDYRRLVQPFFSPKAVEALEQQIRALTIDLINDFHAAGECEFTQDFALKMPIHIAMKLLDLPMEDTPFMLSVAQAALHSVDMQKKVEAYGQIFQYLAEKILPERKKNPGNDIISAIIHGKVEGGRATTDDEVLGISLALIAGALDTVPNMLSFMTLFLARNPAHRQQLIEDPSLIPDAMEEMIRRHHLGNFTRVVIRDMDYKGLQFKAGDIVMSPTTLAGIDDRRYPDPMTVDFGRPDKKHLAFGRGPHSCIGVMLARSELRVFLSEWMKRIPHFEIKSGGQPVAKAAAVNHVLYLPLTWNVA